MLTIKQEKMLTFIKNFVKEHSYSPTHREIKEALGINSAAYLNRVLDKLENLKLITRTTKGTRHNIKLLHSPHTLPLLGKIAAGKPIEAIPQPEELIFDHIVLGENRYLLQVQGDSMVDENICDGDLIICEYCQIVPNGTIVVALINKQEATLKKIYYQRDGIHLIPANTNHLAQIYKPHEIEVQGKFVGLIRLTKSF